MEKGMSLQVPIPCLSECTHFLTFWRWMRDLSSKPWDAAPYISLLQTQAGHAKEILACHMPTFFLVKARI